MRVVVTGIGWNGTIRRTAVDTWCLTELDRWEGIIEMVLACPPEYRAAPGRAVYVIHAGDRAVMVGEEDLTGSMAELVTTMLTAGDPA